uniref:Bax inhibitor 1 n=1 Tax=Kalanchoe fedtschenkoi TaxID=63787 RepID=A0A7N0VI62_KALFE
GFGKEEIKRFYFRHISPVVQNHLRLVYLTLCCALVASAAGAYLHIIWNIGGYITTILSLLALNITLAVSSCDKNKKFSLLMLSALFEGASIGPLIQPAVEIDPRRREYLYLGGLVSAGLSILMWLHFGSAIFGGSMALFKFEIYLGLMVFVGYTVVDTQEIIEKAHSGDLDYVKHALMLFTDFVALFVRILALMLKNSVDKKEKGRGGGGIK